MLRLFKKSIKTGKVTTSYPQSGDGALAYRGQPVVNRESCNRCGYCSTVCPTRAVCIGSDSVTISLDKCLFCGLCTEVCPNKAIKQGNDVDLAYLAHNLQDKARKILGRSLHIRHVDTGSCNACDFEMNALTNPVYDIQRLGVDFVASPRHADMLMVTGSVTEHLATALKKTYAAVPEPKLVVAMGTCACSGGIFQGSYAVVGGVDKIIPVDLYIPGCPPKPETIILGLLKVLDRL